MRRIWAIVLMLVFVLSACGTTPKTPAKEEPTAENCEVHFLNVGKADAIYIVADGCTMLIDAGYAANGQQIVQYLQRQGVKRLDYVVATHGDKDHIGGMASVLTEFEVGKLLISPKTENSVEYSAMKKVIEAKDIEYEIPQLGATYTLGKGSFVVMAPGEAALMENSDNDSSLVLRYVYGEKSFLLMGDALSTTEKELRESEYVLKSDVLKVGHHGEKDATKKKFLKEVSPSYAVICCGMADDAEGRREPDEEVLERLRAHSVTTYRTDLNGTIIFFTDGTSMNVSVEKQ